MRQHALFLIFQYVEGISVLLLFQIGSILEEVMLYRSKKSIANMMDIAPEFANRKSHEQEVQVEPSELECGDITFDPSGREDSGGQQSVIRGKYG